MHVRSNLMTFEIEVQLKLAYSFMERVTRVIELFAEVRGAAYLNL